MPATGAAFAGAGLRSRFLDGLTRSEIETVLASGTQQRFLANSVIVNQGNQAGHFFMLTKGRARYFFITQEGHKNLLYWLTPGHVFGTMAFLPKPSSYLVSTEAVKDSSVIVWDVPQSGGWWRGIRSSWKTRWRPRRIIWAGMLPRMSR